MRCPGSGQKVMTEVMDGDWQYVAICPVCKRSIQVFVTVDGSVLVNHNR